MFRRKDEKLRKINNFERGDISILRIGIIIKKIYSCDSFNLHFESWIDQIQRVIRDERIRNEVGDEKLDRL